MAGRPRDLITTEFSRAAAGFAERTRGRFDDLDVVAFSRVADGATVAEFGAGTGNFLSLFSEVASSLVAVDLTPEMLVQARSRFPQMRAVVGDGRRVPLRGASIDLVASAQTLHHLWRPLPFLREMRRVMAPGGRVLVVDQVTSESYEKIEVRNALERLRDPSHAMSRPPSAFRVMIQAAGLTIENEKIVTGRPRLSRWMWPGEFPEERIARVRRFIEERGHETDFEFEPDGDDIVFTRRRIMVLAR